MLEKKTLSINAATLAAASTCSLALGLISVLGVFGYGQPLVLLLSETLPGFAATGPGFFLAIIWGFLLGGLAGLFYAWIYNKIV